MLLIFIASSIPELGALPGGMSDKSGHSIGYALLGGLLLRAFADGRMAGVTWGRAVLAAALATVYGVTDEFHQSFVPGRTPDVIDIAADAAGAMASAIGIAAVVAVARRSGIVEKSPRPNRPA
jgi:VanZ family protein